MDDSLISEALRMANLAPSAGNLQARDFIVIKDPDTKKALARAAYDEEFVRTAPVVIVVCANLRRIEHYGDRGRTLYCIQDSSAAIENMILFLHSKGIGSVWVGAFDEAAVRILLHIPEEARPVAMIPMGRPAEKGTRSSKIPSDRIVHKEKW